MIDLNEPLKGFHMFVRQTAGMPTVITVDLDRRTGAPDQGKTWVCQVSTKLLKPSRQGVTEDPLEIERLNMLAGRMVDALKVVDSEFVAAATRDGRRTSIFYAAVETGVAAIVERAFADQYDYKPAVSIESDPSWSVYLSFCPGTDEERTIRFSRTVNAEFARHQVTTLAVVKMLQDKGDDMRARKIDFTLLFATAELCNAFADRVLEQGFEIGKSSGPHQTANGICHALNISRVDTPTVPRILQIERYLIVQATNVGGRYDGWGCFQPRADSAGSTKSLD